MSTPISELIVLLPQEIEEEANVIRALYDLIEKYNVPAPPEDVAVYQTLTPSVNNMLQAIDRSLADRDANIEKFCSHLDKDIATLSKKVYKTSYSRITLWIVYY